MIACSACGLTHPPGVGLCSGAAAVEDRIQRGVAALGRSPRRWQVEAGRAVWWALRMGRRGIVYAATGSGKSDAIGLVLAGMDAREGLVDVVVVPTQRLVEQTARDLERVGVEVGRWYQHARETGRRVVVCCRPSLPGLAEHLAAAGVGARLVIVDEAHGLGAESACLQGIRAMESRYPSMRIIGYTATPTREDGIGMGGLWPAGFLYDYPMARAIEDGVILPPEVIVPSVEDRERIGTDHVDEVGLRMIERYAVGPTVVDAETVEEAEAYAAWLRERGVTAEAIHYRCADPHGVVERLRTGVIRVAVHVRMLSEGVDMPWLGTIVIRVKTGSITRYVQTVGRVLRVWTGKTRAIVLDIRDQWAGFGGMPVFTVEDLESEMERDGAERFETLPTGAGKIKRMREKDPVRFISAMESWVRTLHAAYVREGLVKPVQRSEAHWRGLSEKQKEILARWRNDARRSPARHLHPDERERFRAALDTSLGALGGQMLIDIGMALAQAGGRHFREHGTAWGGARGVTTDPKEPTT